MFQVDGKAELQDILDGVFKPPQREERRTRQRYSRRGLAHHPLSLAYQGDELDGAVDAIGDTAAISGAASSMTVLAGVATTDALVQDGRTEGRIINPPPPVKAAGNADAPAVGPIVELLGRNPFPPANRPWPIGE